MRGLTQKGGGVLPTNKTNENEWAEWPWAIDRAASSIRFHSLHSLASSWFPAGGGWWLSFAGAEPRILFGVGV
jgi:hypothetical protein